MSTNRKLAASASQWRDVRGNWTLEEKYADGSSFTVTATFSGERDHGAVVDSDGGVGTYTVEGSDITISMKVAAVTYEYDGGFSTDDYMGGSSQRYVTSDKISYGSWTATRVKTTSGNLQRVMTAIGRKGRK